MQTSLNQVTEKLLASYSHVGGINHLDGKNLPSKRAIAAITVDLLRLLFPGFFDEKPIHSSEIRQETSTLLREVQLSLEEKSPRASSMLRRRSCPNRASVPLPGHSRWSFSKVFPVFGISSRPTLRRPTRATRRP